MTESQNLTTRLSVVVSTSPKLGLQEGEVGYIPCVVEQARKYTAHWKKGDTFDNATLLVNLDMYYNIGEKDGLAYEAGTLDISENNTLIIKNVTKQDEGRYYCEVSDFETGTLHRNYTDVIVAGILHSN